jgi:hypothetical protein
LLNKPPKKLWGREQAGFHKNQKPRQRRERSYFMARTRSPEHTMPPEGCWIKFQLDLRNIKLAAVAQKAHRTVSMVSQVITGVKNSEAVGLALALMLGYASYKDLMEAAYAQTKGGAA